MAKAYQCDNCGELFTRSRDMKYIMPENIVAILIFKRGHETPDLCEECKKIAYLKLKLFPVQLED